MANGSPKELGGSILQLSDDELREATGGENIPIVYQAYCATSGCNWKVNCQTLAKALEYSTQHTQGHHQAYVREIPNPHYI